MTKSLLSFLLFSVFFINADAQQRIKVSLASELKGPYTGRLLVYTLRDTSKQFGMSASEDEAAFSMEVSNWKYGETKEITQTANALNVKLTDLKPGYYKLIAILDTNTYERGKMAPGNLFTRKESVLKVSEGVENNVELLLSHAFPVRPFPGNDSIREITLPSPLLTAFRKYSVDVKAAVVLPPGFEKDKTKTYPVVFIIPGWGGTHHQALSAGARKAYGVGAGSEKIYVFLNPEVQSPYGLHGYVDSRVNGPWGQALIQELMPFMQKTYRASADPRLNFLMGQSTGGYAAVWLALHYPAYFGGTWSTAPDPLDFSSFTGINLYRDGNFYTNENGRERGFNKVKGAFTSTLRKMYALEVFEGDGGQQQSFEAEFGLPDKNGRPRRLFDATTGKIDKAIVNSWKQYDMTLYVKSHADKLRTQLKGPVHVFVGDNDNFLLNESALLFGERVKDFKLPVQVDLVPGADHFQVRSAAVIEEIQREMDLQIRSATGSKK
ncbi:MAG: alpha/beta hydrolase-fold protein [Pseudobacter sp.]|uniref:alpha/beta hydrolase n=1 Tax=Pseudobacter sp. TaxID=2045420 RepID=UPI003F7CE60D